MNENDVLHNHTYDEISCKKKLNEQMISYSRGFDSFSLNHEDLNNEKNLIIHDIKKQEILKVNFLL